MMIRRDFLRLAAAAATTSTIPRWAWSRVLTQRALFPLGVASGAPREDGFVLWTRLLDGAVPGTPRADAEGLTPIEGELTVHWEVAADEGFSRIVQRGQAQALPALGHSVHVEVRGLEPDRWYFYRFMHGDAVTAAARTRTAPAADARAQRLRFAYASCQRWEQGHYAGHRHMLDEDLDLVVFLGDYIYEYAMPSKPPSTPLARTHSLSLATGLGDFRDRYALYKTDPHLQAMHRACPWLVTWDDHEVQNDYAGLYGSESAEAFAARRAAAYQAFYENMPLPAVVLTHGPGGLGRDDALRIYSRHAWGGLADFHVLDTRQYRDLHACREPGAKRKGAVDATGCPVLAESERSMLGREQEAWLRSGLARDARAGTRWSVIAQQTIFMQRNYRALPERSFNSDTWDGYPAARQRLLDDLRASGPRNAVFVGGDIHQNYVGNVLADFDAPDSRVIASEFCGTSLASRTGTAQSTADRIASLNPHILLANTEKRGYGVVELTPQRWTTTLRVLDDVVREDSDVATAAVFVVEDGRPRVQTA